MSVAEHADGMRFFLRNVKAVMFNGVKGGTGKTTICTNAANLLSHDHKVGLLDADIDSPNLAPVLGLEGVMEQTADRLFIPMRLNENLKVFSMTLFTGNRQHAFTKRGHQNQNIINDAIKYTAWGGVEYLFIDLPAGSSDEFRAVKGILGNIIGQIVVTLPNTVDDLMRCIDISSRFDIPILGVIENMAGLVCEECGHSNIMYGIGEGLSRIREMCDEYNIPYLGWLPYIPDLHDDGDPDSFIIPDDHIDIIVDVLEAINGGQKNEDKDDPEDSESDQVAVEEEEHH